VRFDLRLPLGLLFAIFGLILLVQGWLAPPSANTKSLGLNMNLDWGFVQLVFGASKLALRVQAPPRIQQCQPRIAARFGPMLRRGQKVEGHRPGQQHPPTAPRGNQPSAAPGQRPETLRLVTLPNEYSLYQFRAVLALPPRAEQP